MRNVVIALIMSAGVFSCRSSSSTSSSSSSSSSTSSPSSSTSSSTSTTAAASDAERIFEYDNQFFDIAAKNLADCAKMATELEAWEQQNGPDYRATASRDFEDVMKIPREERQARFDAFKAKLGERYKQLEQKKERVKKHCMDDPRIAAVRGRLHP